MKNIINEQTYNALTVNTASGEHKVFLQGGFYLTGYATSCIHEHNYAEIHLVAGGNSAFTVENEEIRMGSGSMLYVPRKTFHSCDSKDESAMHCAFQIDCDIDKVCVYELPQSVVLEFFHLVRRISPLDDHSSVAAYISLFCSSFESNARRMPIPITDYGFLIFEFFSRNYKEQVRLCDLAELLHLSNRQAERLVLEHTGRSFREELAATRVRIANQLLKTTDMSLAEIAEYTGYRSYAGLWKAMKKYN